MKTNLKLNSFGCSFKKLGSGPFIMFLIWSMYEIFSVVLYLIDVCLLDELNYRPSVMSWIVVTYFVSYCLLLMLFG